MCLTELRVAHVWLLPLVLTGIPMAFLSPPPQQMNLLFMPLLFLASLHPPKSCLDLILPCSLCVHNVLCVPYVYICVCVCRHMHALYILPTLWFPMFLRFIGAANIREVNMTGQNNPTPAPGLPEDNSLAVVFICG